MVATGDEHPDAMLLGRYQEDDDAAKQPAATAERKSKGADLESLLQSLEGYGQGPRPR